MSSLGLVALPGPVALLVLVGPAASSPPAVRALRRALGRSTPRLRTDEDLCHDWRATTRALSTAPLSRRMAAVHLREQLLAEMEPCNRAGLQG